MNQKQKLILNESVVALAYAYSLTGYQLASVAFGVLAVILVISFHSWRCVKKNLVNIFSLAFAEVIFIHIFQLQNALPTISFLALVNATFAFVAMESSSKVISALMKTVLPIMLFFLTVLMIIPMNVLVFFVEGATHGFFAMFLILCMMFFPLIFAYIARGIEEEKHYVKKEWLS